MPHLVQIFWEKDGIVVDTCIPGVRSPQYVIDFLNALAPYRTTNIDIAWFANDGVVRYNRTLAGVHKEIVWSEPEEEIAAFNFLPPTTDPGFPCTMIAALQMDDPTLACSKKGVRYVTIPGSIYELAPYCQTIVSYFGELVNVPTLTFAKLRTFGIRGGL